MQLVIEVPDDSQVMCEWHMSGICDLTDIELGIYIDAIRNGRVLKHGRWVQDEDNPCIWECSECHARRWFGTRRVGEDGKERRLTPYEQYYNFCPTCQADMRGGTDGDS